MSSRHRLQFPNYDVFLSLMIVFIFENSVNPYNAKCGILSGSSLFAKVLVYKYFAANCFARVSSNISDLNNNNQYLTAKLLKQGYQYHKLRKAFSRLFQRHSELIIKYNVGLKTLLQQGSLWLFIL